MLSGRHTTPLDRLKEPATTRNPKLGVLSSGLSLGEPASIAHAFRDEEAEYAAPLIEDGFRQHLIAGCSVIDMMREAVGECLASYPGAPSEIQLALFVTDSHWDAEFAGSSGHNAWVGSQRPRNALLALLETHGMSSCYPVGISLGACNNLGSALVLMKALSDANVAQRFLVVVADRTQPGESRFTATHSSVYSDAAVAFVVGPSEAGVLLEVVSTSASPGLVSTLGMENSPTRLIGTARALGRLKKDFESKAGRKMKDHDLIFMPHHHIGHTKTICDVLDIPISLIYRESIQNHGHSYASDSIISLLNYCRSIERDKDMTLLTINAAAELWSAASFLLAAGGVDDGERR